MNVTTPAASASTTVGHIRIPLRSRKGEIVAHAMVAYEDAAQAGHRWYRNSQGYATRSAPRGNSKRALKLFLHREVLGLAYGDGIKVDHKNRDPLDCRRSNLRIATHFLNSQNLGSRPGSTSKYRGVTWAKNRGKWQAQANVNGRGHYLGIFDREEDAAAAASAWRAEHMPYSADAALGGCTS